MGRVTARRPVLRINEHGTRTRPDTLAAEEPLEIRIDGRALSVTMRTPGHDVELAHGFLLTEGVIGDVEDLRSARYCDSPGPDGRNTYNVLDVQLAPGVQPPDTSVERNFYTTSSCGVCGKAALDSVKLSTRHSPAGDALRLSPEVLAELPDEVTTAALIGHNPGLEDLVRLLTGQQAELKTAGIAVLSTAATWSEAGESWAEADDFAKPRG